MAKFCGSCGAQLSDTSAFCIQCGSAQNAASAPAPTPPQPPTPAPVPPQAQPAYAQVNTPAAAPPPAQYSQVNAPPSMPPQGAKSSGSGLKILLGILAVLFVGGLLVVGGLFYIGHRVVNKIKATAAENGISLPSDSKSSSSSSSSSSALSSIFHSDPCSLLSKDDVSAAAGVPIVATHANTDGGCDYLAQGTAADMTAKHVSSMMAARGADSKTQDTIQKFAGGLFSAQQQSESKGEPADPNGTVAVITFSVDTNNAKTQMELNSKVLGGLGGGAGSGAIAGIGDEAFDSAGGIMFVRKGDKLVRIFYITCPCNTEAIKPLARKLADAL